MQLLVLRMEFIYIKNWHAGIFSTVNEVIKKIYRFIRMNRWYRLNVNKSWNLKRKIGAVQKMKRNFLKVF